jgi:hypothetical protein
LGVKPDGPKYSSNTGQNPDLAAEGYSVVLLGLEQQVEYFRHSNLVEYLLQMEIETVSALNNPSIVYTLWVIRHHLALIYSDHTSIPTQQLRQIVKASLEKTCHFYTL